MTEGGEGGSGPRKVMPGCARKFSHLRKRVHRPRLRVSIARQWRRWFKFRKRKEVSPGSVCHLEENTRSPGQGKSPQPALVAPAASNVRLGLRLPFKFEFQRREPRACVRDGAGRAAPRPGAGSRGLAGPAGSQGGGAALAQPPHVAWAAGIGGGVALPAHKPPPGPEPHPQRSHTPPGLSRSLRLGRVWAFCLPAFLSMGLRAPVSCEIPPGPLGLPRHSLRPPLRHPKGHCRLDLLKGQV